MCLSCVYPHMLGVPGSVLSRTTPYASRSDQSSSTSRSWDVKNGSAGFCDSPRVPIFLLHQTSSAESSLPLAFVEEQVQTNNRWTMDLTFQARCLRLVLSTAIAPPGGHAQRNENDRRAWLLNYRSQKVGTAWYVPIMEQYHNSEVDAILLLKNKSRSASDDGWHFDQEVGAWDEWCLCNVMLIIRLPERGLSERLTIGKIHERSAEHAWEETIRLV